MMLPETIELIKYLKENLRISVENQGGMGFEDDGFKEVVIYIGDEEISRDYL